MNIPEPRMPLSDVAALAKLSIAPEEADALAADMDRILAFARQLQSLDLTGVPETAHAVPLENVLREDVPHTAFKQEEMLRAAPTREDAYITVPPTFAQGGADA